MKDNYKFIAILEYGTSTIGVYFPDLDGCITGGDNVDEAIKNASDVLKLHLYGMEKDNDVIPEPSSISDFKLESNEVAIIVDIYMKPFRERMDEKYIKKTLSIPNWLNTIAEEKEINFSKVLKEALIEQLELK